MFEDHMPQPFVIRGRCPHQLRKQCAFFLCLVVIIRKRSQEPQKLLDVLRLNGFGIFRSRCHSLKHFQGPQDYFVILNQKGCTFHTTILPPEKLLLFCRSTSERESGKLTAPLIPCRRQNRTTTSAEQMAI